MPPVRWQVTQLSISIGAIVFSYEMFACAARRAASGMSMSQPLTFVLASRHCRVAQNRIESRGRILRVASIGQLPALGIDDEHFAVVDADRATRRSTASRPSESAGQSLALQRPQI